MAIKLLGAPELFDRFSALDEAVKTRYIDEALQAGAQVIYDSLERKAPVDKGTLRNAIRIGNISKTPGKIVKGIFIDKAAFYWRFLEFGKRITGHAFVRQAYKNRRSTARQTIRDTFRDRVLGFKD